jgi:hypothetical protein
MVRGEPQEAPELFKLNLNQEEVTGKAHCLENSKETK